MSKMIQTQGLSTSSMRMEEETMMLIQKNQGIVTVLGDTYTASASSLRRTLSADMSSKKWICPQDYSSTMKKIASSEELLHHHPKNIANSFSSSSCWSSEGEEDYEERKELDPEAEAEAEAERERLEIWSSIQRNKKEEQKKSETFDTWGSIMSLKGSNNNNNTNLEISKSLPVTVTPYVHPLVKRSKSSLSEKSLEICTESLGSETGSDGLLFSSSSSYPSSESRESEVEKEQQQNQEEEEEEEVKVKVSELSPESEEAEKEWLLYNNHVAATTKNKSPPRSFPPPLPSLSFQANNKGTSLHMRPHRDNGRLVLQAVSLPSQNNFNAQRQDGRLVLTFANDEDEEAAEVEEENYYNDDDESVEELEEEELGGFEGEEEKEDEDDYEGEYDDEEEEDESEEESEGEVVGDVESVMQKAPLLSSGITTSGAHRLALMMNKQIGLVNRNPNWSEKFNNKGVNLEDVGVVEMEPRSAMAQSLPPRVARLIPSAAPASSFNLNAYEYFRKTKPTPKSDQIPNHLAYQKDNNNNSPHKNNYSSKAIVSGGDMNLVSNNEQQQLLVLRGKNGDYLVHNFKSCKDSRRSLLFWEPYCIATS